MIFLCHGLRKGTFEQGVLNMDLLRGASNGSPRVILEGTLKGILQGLLKAISTGILQDFLKGIFICMLKRILEERRESLNISFRKPLRNALEHIVHDTFQMNLKEHLMGSSRIFSTEHSRISLIGSVRES